MIYVSHRLDEIFRIADRVAVLARRRAWLARSRWHETTPDELIEMIVGRKTDQLFAKATSNPGETVVSVRDLACRRRRTCLLRYPQRTSCLGLVGLRGAGQELIGRALFGCEAFSGAVDVGWWRYRICRARSLR